MATGVWTNEGAGSASEPGAGKTDGERPGRHIGARSNGGERGDTGRLANGLGWFSIGLGLAQITVPGGVARLVGAPPDDRTRMIMRLMGMREIASGLGLLARPRPTRWMWTRVAGDVLDLTLLGTAMAANGSRRGRVGLAATAIAGVAAIDYAAGRQLRQLDGDTTESGAAVEVTRSITVNRSVEEVYGFWRDFRNLPRFMLHLEAVEVLDDLRSRWKARGPGGVSVSWEAEIIEERTNELLSWHSVSRSHVDNAGTVRFLAAPGNRGTEIHVTLRYVPPAGSVGAALAKLFGEEPGQQVRDDLRAFKQVIETGEVVRSDGSMRGPRQQRQHPAQPRMPDSLRTPEEREQQTTEVLS
jgi:uncharacterized membrane protein